jgi:uracil-DNA glycosylase family 4
VISLLRFAEPHRDCGLCPRLRGFIAVQRALHSDWHNAPVPAFGSLDARLLIVGLAPGLRGANLSGRPFTGDYAGDLLYSTLAAFGLTAGTYGAAVDDGFHLVDCRVTNAVRCVPPGNRPVGAEVLACRNFLTAEISAMNNLRVIVALGGLAHGAILVALGQRKSVFKFSHGAVHIPNTGGANLHLVDSYHCSRYNTNTKRLTEGMFHDVFRTACRLIE